VVTALTLGKERLITLRDRKKREKKKENIHVSLLTWSRKKREHEERKRRD